MRDKNYTQDEIEEVSRVRDQLFLAIRGIESELSRLKGELLRMNKILDHNLVQTEAQLDTRKPDFGPGIDW